MSGDVVSLFAGIGGFDLGFQRAGFRIAAHVEKDANCRKLLAARWPDAAALDDVCTAGEHNLPACDVVTFGFPCQDLSVAGKRAGLAGGRSGLFYEATRIINELRPAFALFENVPGLLSSDGGRDFARVLMEMDRIGYCGAWRVLDAQWLGVAQRRRRVFGLFSRLDSGAERCAEILSLEESLRGHPAPCREAGQGVAGCLTGGANGGSSHGKKSGTDREGFLTVAKAVRTPTGGIDREDGHTLITCPLTGNPYGDHVSRESLLIPAVAQQIVNTLTRRMQGSSGWAPYNETEHLIPAVAGCLSHNGKQERDAKGAKSDIKPGHLVPVMALSERTRANGSTFEVERDPVMPALKTGTQRQQAVAVPVAQVQWASGGGKVHNLTAQALRSGAEHNYQFAQVGMQVRRLTPTECARLQGFPDDWLDGLGFSDSTKYKCLGNAVCVNVTEWIARRLACADTGG